jgi:hypothetical protein
LLQFFTEGNLPDALLEVPEGWGTPQIREWQMYWDALFSGNTAQRRKGTWVPKGMTPHHMKEADLKNPIDEWFARVVCYCFSVSPQPFIAQINRATAETAAEMALEEGLAPLQEWVKDAADEGLERGGYNLVEFAWEEEVAVQPREQAEIDEILGRAAIKRRSEIRAERGLEDDGVPDFIVTTGGVVLLDDIGKVSGQPPAVSSQPEKPPPEPEKEPGTGDRGPETGDRANKLAKANRRPKTEDRRPVPRIDRDRPDMIQARADLAAIMAKAFRADAAAAAAHLAEGLGLAKMEQGSGARGQGPGKTNNSVLSPQSSVLEKADEDQAAKIDRLLRDLNLAGIEATYEEIQVVLTRAAQSGGLAAMAQINFDNPDITRQVNKLAVEWAENRAAELVGKKWVDGSLVVNPDPKWAITEATRDYLRADVTQAMEEGWSTAQLSKAIQENYGFSEGRSNTIARTEIGQADVEGNMMAYRESGVVEGKEWILGSEHQDDDECTDNAAEGIIPLDQPFSSGHMNPLAHPNCVCDVLPVVAAREEG